MRRFDKQRSGRKRAKRVGEPARSEAKVGRTSTARRNDLKPDTQRLERGATSAEVPLAMGGNGGSRARVPKRSRPWRVAERRTHELGKEVAPMKGTSLARNWEAARWNPRGVSDRTGGRAAESGPG